MENPFVFGRIASGPSFTNRKKECQHLIDNFKAGIHTIIISPRRWGKSSLVREAAGQLKDEPALIFCYMDLFNIRNEQEFLQVFAATLLKATSSKWEERVRLAKKLFKKLIPLIHLGQDPANDFTISFQWSELQKDPGEILDLPESISLEKNIRLIVCLDEFQNIAFFEDSLAFQKRLRSFWQYHQHVGYCIYGSKKHMMTEVFERKSMPFYKFGDLLMLEKINAQDWVPFLVARFSASGKSISEDLAGRIASDMQFHPYFVQQLAATAWRLTAGACKTETLDESMEELMIQQSVLFVREIENMTNTQVNFLKALCDGVKYMSSLDILNKYSLGSTSNITRIKKALYQKEVIDNTPAGLQFTDPLFEYWFRTKYMHSY